jgi:hypothetical protein
VGGIMSDPHEYKSAVAYLSDHPLYQDGRQRFTVLDEDKDGNDRMFGRTDDEVAAILYAAGGYTVFDNESGERVTWLGKVV